MSGFIPVSRAEMLELGIEQFDFVYILGDAYVDHPSFGAAIITRVLEHNGFTVGIIAQPDWHKDNDFQRLGKPKLGFLVSAGNIDSMVAHYSVAKKEEQPTLIRPETRRADVPTERLSSIRIF